MLLLLLFSYIFGRVAVEECVSRTKQYVTFSEIDGDSDVKSSSLYMSDIDASVVRSSELFQSNAESGSKVNRSKLYQSPVTASTVVCSHLSFSSLKRSRVEKSKIDFSEITNSTILNTEISFSPIKHSYIKDYKEEISCFEIEYCNNRENIGEGKVHIISFYS